MGKWWACRRQSAVLEVLEGRMAELGELLLDRLPMDRFHPLDRLHSLEHGL